MLLKQSKFTSECITAKIEMRHDMYIYIYIMYTKMYIDNEVIFSKSKNKIA